MSIEARVVVTIASVEVTDGYEVELRTDKKRTVLTPDEAAKLADEIYEAAMGAAAKAREDRVRLAGAHSFDVQGER